MRERETTVNGYQARVWTSTVRLACWGAAWLAATALMQFGPRFIWHQAPGLTRLAIGFSVVVGIGLILANKRYVTELDELQQKIYLNALGITVGVALIGGVPLSVMDFYRVISFHAQIWHLLMLMNVTFLVFIVYGNVCYR